MIGETFPRQCRLTRRSDYLRVQGRGERFHLPHFLVFIDRESATRSADSPRLGVTVTRKVGPSVHRNRIKRLVREGFRRSRRTLPAGVDVVWVAKRNARAVQYDDVSAGFARLARRLERGVR